MNSRSVQVFLLALIILGIVLLIFQKYWVPQLVDAILENEGVSQVDTQATSSNPNNSGKNDPQPQQATLTGQQICLPHKVTTGPQTKECATGIKTDTGEYFALDFNLMSQIPPEIQNGMRFTATGIITPIETLSSDHWQKYNVKGIFSVTGSVVLEKVIEPNNPPAVTKKCYVGGCSAQICTDQEGMASDCQYREEYMCYQTATCEVQTSGECGWTETPELTTCLSGAL